MIDLLKRLLNTSFKKRSQFNITVDSDLIRCFQNANNRIVMSYKFIFVLRLNIHQNNFLTRFFKNSYDRKIKFLFCFAALLAKSPLTFRHACVINKKKIASAPDNISIRCSYF